MPDIGDLAKAIQLALAPVFLLTGIGALLTVMTGRLGRIIDRGRAFAGGDVRLVAADHGSSDARIKTSTERRLFADHSLLAASYPVRNLRGLSMRSLSNE